MCFCNIFWKFLNPPPPPGQSTFVSLVKYFLKTFGISPLASRLLCHFLKLFGDFLQYVFEGRLRWGKGEILSMVPPLLL